MRSDRTPQPLVGSSWINTILKRLQGPGAIFGRSTHQPLATVEDETIVKSSPSSSCWPSFSRKEDTTGLKSAIESKFNPSSRIR